MTTSEDEKAAEEWFWLECNKAQDDHGNCIGEWVEVWCPKRCQPEQAFLAGCEHAKKQKLKFEWKALTDEQRLELNRQCCRRCGSLNTRCQCWDD